MVASLRTSIAERLRDDPLADQTGGPILIAMSHLRACAVLVCLLLFGAGAAMAAGDAGTKAAAPNATSSRDDAIDLLYAELAVARNKQTAEALEKALQNEFLRSGSPSIDLLMQRGLDAFKAARFDRAFFYFDEVVTLAPEYAEGWNKRATIYYLRNDYTHALRDLEHVLRLEPRHYEAMVGLAVMLQDLGDNKGALDLYRRAKSINPWLEGADAAIKTLQLEVEGQGI